ncbi:m-AAA protease-interacting protein 1, mitochondrial [Spea bombifrons]|uniref:m-AAA protease-interacting protein 1, mitochondrial n=1 Tax=Spea bombifrons TaxID=233779 RepID=UPI0023495286|nr:m-AAA protease-interacting protein 1, mitochondrial [Spea bombifrons]
MMDRMLRSVFRLSRFCVRVPVNPHCGIPASSFLRWSYTSLLQSRSRGYNSNPAPRRVVVLGIHNPFIWCRTRVYFFLIRAFFDRDFSIDEFTEGAKQAFILVSGLMSEGRYEALENLVTHEVIQNVHKKCTLLSDIRRNALAVSWNEIMYSTVGDVAIYYDDNGRKFVNILMRFWYLKHSELPDENLQGTKVFQIVLGDENVKDKKFLLTANYEFRREFTQGLKPDWIITWIEHSKILE